MRAVALLVTAAFLTPTNLNAAPSDDTLSQHQAARDALFKTLTASATSYTFKYVVITLPAGAVPGKNFPIPVSHIRYESTVLFKFDDFLLQPNAKHILTDLAQVIQQDAALRSLLIVGHTDSVGADEYNVTLSKKRAFTVAINLQTEGVNAKYIHIIPMGKEQPFATNSTVEGRELNRRVEFFISDIPEATEKAVQLIPFNPCFRNDRDVERVRPGGGCDDTPKRIPVFSSDSDSRPTGLISLTPRPPERPKLPDNKFERPSLRELDSNSGR
jgi:outer membrane protein OmpA-like peptidoglycan-associated protein